MSFWSYMGHRLLGGVLVFLGFVMILAGLLSGAWYFVLIGIALLVAGGYFFKTQH